MQPIELENKIFSHRVVTENGFEKIVPTGELDPNVQSRVLTILEAQAIVDALINMAGPKIEHADVAMFEPIEMAVPVETSSSVEKPIAEDPSKAAYDAAVFSDEYRLATTAANEQFALGA
jgi:hypothetical protein